ncbi:hypothetical protein PG593_08550 [Riemerella anatipestifer]|uniref:hypothetical protein n=1 Tax=Riemerella anatipestifer TaxID=34085 RepID=UPI002A8F827D|nr:hypothetical protein [Riemerella anatipestifer]MDY3538316.1 hypothetical protein [Riemerella anatipestifer]
MNNKGKIKLLALILILLVLFKEIVVYKPILNFFPTNKKEGRIINEKNYLRRGFLTGAFTYSYCFEVENIVYTNDSYNEKYEVGDIVLVEYSKKFPFMNRIVEK